MTHLNAYIDDVTVVQLEQTRSPPYVAKAWTQLSSSCPNDGNPADTMPLRPETPASASTLGFKTVAAALSTLTQQPGLEVSNQGGWTIIYDPKTSTIWSFTASGHDANPSVVRRTFKPDGPQLKLELVALCPGRQAILRSTDSTV